MSYRTKSTTKGTAAVDDVWLAEPTDSSNRKTRRILRAEINANTDGSGAHVKACILHQKRHDAKAAWEDADSFKLTTLKAGQEIRLQLTSGETLSLHQNLEQLVQIAEKGVPIGIQHFETFRKGTAVEVKGRSREYIRKLLAESPEDFWKELRELQPELLRAKAVFELHKVREAALADFEAHLAAGDWKEGKWQEFFEANTWIFGYGLCYRFLHMAQPQPQYGGLDVRGRGGQRGDFLMATEAAARFTVLVEIKTPTTELVDPKPYRNRAIRISGDLAGGVAQIQTNCRTWETEGSRTNANRDALAGTYTIQPKGLLIIGNTSQLATPDQRSSFETFRRNLHNPEVLTFDELLLRARYLLQVEGERLGSHGEEVGGTEEEMPF